MQIQLGFFYRYYFQSNLQFFHRLLKRKNNAHPIDLYGFEIDDEWELCTKELVQEKDPELYDLLTDPQYKLATILPDGAY